LKGVDWIHLVQDRDRWRAFVNTVMSISVPWKAGKFLTNWVYHKVLKDSTPWSYLVVVAACHVKDCRYKISEVHVENTAYT
jgi:hypothetical protein